jgi:hypothetical protein
MKKQIFAGLIALGATIGAYAQPQSGTFTFDNSDGNPLATPTSTNFGLIFFCPGSSIIPLNQDINLTLLGGATAGSLSQIATLTFANGTAQGDNTALGIPGQFLNTSAITYTVPGVGPGGTAYFELEAWFGNAPTYQEADAFGDVVGNSGIYQSKAGNNGSPPLPPLPIGDGMPSFTVGECPEPTTIALGGLGGTALLFLRRKK